MAIQYFKTLGVFFDDFLFVLISQRGSANSPNSKYRLKIQINKKQIKTVKMPRGGRNKEYVIEIREK